MESKSSTLIHEVSPDQITKLFEGIQNQIKELKHEFEPKTPTEYLTREETAKYFKVDLSTVHNWTKKQKLTAYGMAGRVYYKRSEVEAAFVQLNKGKETVHA